MNKAAWETTKPTTGTMLRHNRSAALVLDTTAFHACSYR